MTKDYIYSLVKYNIYNIGGLRFANEKIFTHFNVIKLPNLTSSLLSTKATGKNQSGLHFAKIEYCLN